MSTVNVILDFVLVAASIWMILAVRGVGGVMGRTLNLIVVGAIILGIAHLLATAGTNLLHIESSLNNFIHRIVVLVGFVFLVIGFRQISAIKN